LKVKVAIKRSYGDVIVEGDSFDEVTENMKSLPQWLDVLDSLILRSESSLNKKDLLKGVVENTVDGVVVTIPKERLRDKEAICLILYANEPNPLQPKDIARLLTISGRLSAGFGARLSELRNEGLILKDGASYRLTASGKSMVEDILLHVKT